MSTAAITHEEVVHIPADVRDLDSFRRWVHSEEFPDRAKITYVKGEIIIEFNYDVGVYIPAGVTNLDGFRRWVHSDDFPQRGRITWVKGEIIVDMSPAEISRHNKVIGAIYGVLWNLVTERDIGELLPDRTLVVNEQAGVSNEPDLTFCSWDSLRSGRVTYRESTTDSERQIEVNGSPDMVLEVVSPSSVLKDTQTLRTAYFEAGVQEYWLIDARGREIDFHLLTRGDKEYVPAEPDADGFRASTIFNAAFRLTRGTNPVGGVRYHLDLHPTTD